METQYNISIEDFNKEQYIEYKSGVWIHKDVDMDRPIYRYIKIQHLYSLIKKSKLHFSNRRTFSDLREQGKKEDIRHMFSCILDAKLDKEIAQARYRVYSQRKKSAENDTAISCWTWDSHGADCDESYILWKWFGKKHYRIKSTVKALVENIDIRDKMLIISNVEYKKESYDSTLQAQIFRKDIRYADEQEIRLCVLNSPDKIELPIIEVSNIILNIRPSPFISKYQNDLISEHMTKEFRWLQNRFEYTTIIENE